MKRVYLNYFSAFLVGSCLAAIVPVKANISTSVTIVQATATYNQHMRNGYAATTKRDYKTALKSFRNALKLRPNDKYALQAISNVSGYAKALRGDRITYVPRNTGAPEGRSQAATRGGACLSPGAKSMLALVPKGEVLTTEKLPVLLVYMPQNVDTKVEFILQDSNDKEIHKTNIAPSKKAGIVSLDLATFPKIPSLENGKKYHWYLTLLCDENERSADIFVEGFIKKVALDPLLVKELQAAKPSDRAALYTVNGIWYDAVATLYKARLSRPNDPVLNQGWADLLQSVDLIEAETLANKDEILAQKREELAKEPLIECCTATRNKEGQ